MIELVSLAVSNASPTGSPPSPWTDVVGPEFYGNTHVMPIAWQVVTATGAEQANWTQNASDGYAGISVVFSTAPAPISFTGSALSLSSAAATALLVKVPLNLPKAAALSTSTVSAEPLIQEVVRAGVATIQLGLASSAVIDLE